MPATARGLPFAHPLSLASQASLHRPRVVLGHCGIGTLVAPVELSAVGTLVGAMEFSLRMSQHRPLALDLLRPEYRRQAMTAARNSGKSQSYQSGVTGESFGGRMKCDRAHRPIDAPITSSRFLPVALQVCLHDTSASQPTNKPFLRKLTRYCSVPMSTSSSHHWPTNPRFPIFHVAQI